MLSGAARLHDTDLLGLSRGDMRRVWGSRIGLVSQDPQGAFNPTLTVGRQLDEMGRRHLGLGRRAARDLTLTMLRRVDMPDPGSVAKRYPHQLSGGMLQRSAIAMALLTSPELLILDEPTTALDVTTQAMVLDLLDELKAEFSSAILYITHNLGVVSRICDRVAIMYAGEIFEEATTARLFEQPLHPYTLNLLNCVPRFGTTDREDAAPEDAGRESDASGGSGAAAGTGGRLATIAGALPRPDDLPAGCVFAPRCPLALDACRVSRPPLTDVADGRSTACWRWEVLLSQEGRRAALQQPGLPGPARPADNVAAETRPAAGAHFVEANEITKVFPIPGRRSGVRAVDGVSVWIDPRAHAGSGGRERQRQDHPGQSDRWVECSEPRTGLSRWRSSGGDNCRARQDRCFAVCRWCSRIQRPR